MKRYKNPIIALGATAVLAVAPSLATVAGSAPARRTAIVNDTSAVSTDSLLAATPLFDRLFLAAVNDQLAGNDSMAMARYDSCLAINPDAAEVYYRQALFYEDIDNDSLSAQSLERAAQLQPGNDTYQEKVAASYIQKRDYKSAIKAYESLYAHHHERTDVLELLVRLYGTQNDYANMLHTADRMEQEDGESDELTFLKMNIYEMRHDKKNALRMLKHVCDRHPYEPNYKVMLGNWLRNNDDKKEALTQYEAALKLDADNEYALSSLSDYYRAEGKTDAADMLRDKILFSPKTADKTKASLLQNAIRESEKAGGDSLPVLRLFDNTIKASPKSVDIINLKAMYMKLKNMPEDSVNATFEHVIAIEPENVTARVNLIQNLWPAKKWDKVIKLSREGTQYSPEEMAFYYFLGIAYFQTDREDDALDALKRGVSEINEKSDPDIVSDFYAMMGDILYKKNRPEEAFAAYDSCLQWKDNNLMALNNYAYYLSEKRINLKKAETMSARTIKAEPTNATYLDTYAWILFLEKRHEEAKAYIDRALENDTDSTEGPSAVVIEHAGDIYNACGDHKHAAELWQKAIDAGGNKEALERKIKKSLQ